MDVPCSNAAAPSCAPGAPPPPSPWRAPSGRCRRRRYIVISASTGRTRSGAGYRRPCRGCRARGSRSGLGGGLHGVGNVANQVRVPEVHADARVRRIEIVVEHSPRAPPYLTNRSAGPRTPRAPRAARPAGRCPPRSGTPPPGCSPGKLLRGRRAEVHDDHVEWNPPRDLQGRLRHGRLRPALSARAFRRIPGPRRPVSCWRRWARARCAGPGRSRTGPPASAATAASSW